VERLTTSLIVAKERQTQAHLAPLECAMPPLFTFGHSRRASRRVDAGSVTSFACFGSDPERRAGQLARKMAHFHAGQIPGISQLDGAVSRVFAQSTAQDFAVIESYRGPWGRDVSKEALCDALWRDERGRRSGATHFHHRIEITKAARSTRPLSIKVESVSAQSGNRCWVDAWVFEARLAETGSTARKCWRYMEVLFPVRGRSDVVECGANGSDARKIHRRFVRYRRGSESEGDLPGRSSAIMRGIDADPIVESFHLGLMRCYEQLSNANGSSKCLPASQAHFICMLGVPPSDATQRLVRDMLQRQSEVGVLPGTDS